MARRGNVEGEKKENRCVYGGECKEKVEVEERPGKERRNMEERRRQRVESGGEEAAGLCRRLNEKK